MNLAEWAFGCLKLQVSDYSQLSIYHYFASDHSCTEGLGKNKAANTPITFEEMVMVMIRLIAFKGK